MASNSNVNVIIDGQQFDTDHLFTVIPERYRNEFEGHSFKSMKEFSKAVMFAKCAQEARYYNTPWKVTENENTLRNILEYGW